MSIFFKITEFIYSVLPTFEKWIKECNGYYATHFDKKRGRWVFESVEFKDAKVERIRYIIHEGKRYTVQETVPYKNYQIRHCTDGSFICLKSVVMEFPHVCAICNTVKTKTLGKMMELLDGQ